MLKIIKFILETIRCSPHLLIFSLSGNKRIIKAEVRHWLAIHNEKYSVLAGIIFLLGFKKPFRNLFYYRIGSWKYLLNVICPKVSTLLIASEEIAEGLFIWHGYSTIIGAKYIGRNCQIDQQVTIGSQDGYPTILDNVTIHSGAIIVGEITIGNNVIIGANSTVFKDVPDNCTVYPSTPRIMKWCKED